MFDSLEAAVEEAHWLANRPRANSKRWAAYLIQEPGGNIRVTQDKVDEDKVMMVVRPDRQSGFMYRGKRGTIKYHCDRFGINPNRIYERRRSRREDSISSALDAAIAEKCGS